MNPDTELYHTIRRVRENDTKLLLDDVMPRFEWTDSEYILDIGLGMSDTARAILLPRCQRCTKFVAIDSRFKMVEHAQQRYPSGKIDYLLADIEERETLSIKWESRFNKIFSFHYFCLVEDQRKALENIYHLFAPKGHCVLLFLTWTDIWQMVEDLALSNSLLAALKDVLNNMPQTQFLSSEERIEIFRDWLDDIGFDVITCSEIQSSFIFKNDDDCKGLVEILCPTMEKMPNDIREKIMDNCLRLLNEKKMKNELHHHEFYYSKMIVHARKP